MTKAIKAAELYTANPSISNADFVKLLMSELGMSLAGARTYSYNVRNGKVTTSTKASKAPKAKPTKAAKAAKKVIESVEKSADDLENIRTKNLAMLRAVSKKHRNFREQMDDVIKANSPGFDPDEARREIREDEEAFLASQGIVAKPQMFD